MKIKVVSAVILLFLSAACTNRLNFANGGGTAVAQAAAIGQNIMNVDVGNCGPNGYFNEPCVSVTICTPGTANCQTIPNILLDTGSFGLRIFSSLITVGLNQQTDASGNPIAQCAMFGTANEWGPVQYADVVLAGEKAPNVPIQVINSSFASVPSDCTSPNPDPASAGFNGILGVGNLTQDCGQDCVDTANNGIYFSCSGANCTSVAEGLNQQVINPVALMPLDNNGIILTLPSVPLGGTSIVSGTVTLGIGTQANNMPPNALNIFQLDGNANFPTIYNNNTYSGSFIDSGSNGYFFPGPSSLTACNSNGIASGFYCPNSEMYYNGTQTGATGSTTLQVSFEVANAQNELSTNYNVFSDIGGSGNDSFDWGIPFFFGRTVYIGFDGASSSIGTGSYSAY